MSDFGNLFFAALSRTCLLAIQLMEVIKNWLNGLNAWVLSVFVGDLSRECFCNTASLGNCFPAIGAFFFKTPLQVINDWFHEPILIPQMGMHKPKNGI